MQPNPHYEAGYTRAVDHAEPEDLLAAAERRARMKKLGLIAIATIAVAGAIGVFARTSGETPAKQLERGKQLIAADQHPAAIVELKRSLLDDPNQPEVRFLLGQEYALLGDAKAAEAEFGKALELKYDPERTLPLLVGTMVQQERFQKAVATINAANVVSPAANADLKALLGTAYAGLGRQADADAAWKAAKDYVPSHPGALLAEAKARAASGALDEARALLAAIPPTAPRQNEVLVLRGDLARAAGKAPEATAAYEAAVALDPSNLPLRANLAQAYVDLGRYDDAQQQVARVLAGSPVNARAHYIAAQAAYAKRDLRTAFEEVTQAVQQAPRDGRAHLLAGRIATEITRPEEAELSLREAVALLPKDPTARIALADFYVKKHDAARADDAIAPLFAAMPDDARVAGILARIALLRGDAMRASKAYDQVDPARADHVEANLHAASLKFAVGDNAGGFARLRAAAAANPDDPDVDAALVSAYLKLNLTKDALAAWNGMSRKRPDDARTYAVRASIDLAVGDRAAARRALEKAVDLDPKDFTTVASLVQRDVDERQVDEARKRLRTFIAANPDQGDAVLKLVDIEKAHGGRDDEVLALLRQARRDDPRSTRVVAALAAYEGAHGDPQQALRTADAGLALSPGNPALLAIAGDAALAAGNAPRATAIFKTLTATDAESVDYPTRLGDAWLVAGDAEAALASFRTALARQPERVELHRSLVGRLLAAGKAEEASRLLFEINRLSPKSAALLELDADVKLARRQFPEAIAAYRLALERTPTSEAAIRAVEGLRKAREPGEANALLASWVKAHPTDETIRRFDAEDALRAKDYGRAGEDFRALLRLHPNDADLKRELAATEAQSGSSLTATAASGSAR